MIKPDKSQTQARVTKFLNPETLMNIPWLSIMGKGKKTKPEIYKKLKEIGEGANGKAYLVEWSSDKVSIIILNSVVLNCICF